MIQELELAIRAIVRDELKRAVLVGGATDQASQQRKEKNEYGLRWSGRGLYGTQDAMVAVVAASDRPLSTRDIGSILWDENLGIEMAAFRHALRNAAHVLSSKGKLHCDKSNTGNYLYSIPKKP